MASISISHMRCFYVTYTRHLAFKRLKKFFKEPSQTMVGGLLKLYFVSKKYFENSIYIEPTNATVYPSRHTTSLLQRRFNV